MRVSELQELAERIYLGSNPQLKQEMEKQVLAVIGQFENLPVVLEAMRGVPYSMLLVGSGLLQLIRKGEYMKPLSKLLEEAPTCGQEKLEMLNKDIREAKHRSYWTIIQHCLAMLADRPLESYLRNTLVQLSAASLRQLLHYPEDIVYFQNFLKLAFSDMEVLLELSNDYGGRPVMMSGRNLRHPPNLYVSLNILASLMDDLLEYANYKNYYEMKRTINLFRMRYLPLVLQVAIYHFKLLFMLIQGDSKMFQALAPEFVLCLKLMEYVLNYPFTLIMTEFDNELEVKDQGNGEICFPDYFRCMTGDVELLKALAVLHNAIVTTALPTNEHSAELVKLIAADLGRLSGASTYLFNDAAERKAFRFLCIDILCQLLKPYNFPNQYYTNTLIAFANRVLVCYNYTECLEKFKQLSDSVLVFCTNIVATYPLELQYIDANVISRAFEMLKRLEGSVPTCYFIEDEEGESISDMRRRLFLDSHRRILQLYLQKLTDLPMLVRLLSQRRFRTHRKETDCFKEMFSPVVLLFDKDFDENMRKLEQTSLDNLPVEAQQVLMHFFTRMLFEERHSMIPVPCQPVKLFYRNIMKKTELSVSDFAFLEELLNNLLAEVEWGESASGLWIRMRMDEDFFSFPDVIEQCIARCLQCFGRSDERMLDCSLELLKKIYGGIQKHHRESLDLNFQRYTQLLITFLEGLETTVFAQPEFFKKRILLFEMISLIWLQGGQPADAYNFYNRIQGTLMQQTHFDNFLKYVYDCTGLVGEVSDVDVYRILFDLILRNLPKLLNTYMGGDTSNEAYVPVRKALLRLFEALLKDTNQRLSRCILKTTPMPLQVEFLWPIIQQFSQHQYNNRLIVVWKALAQINLLRPLPPLPPISNISKIKYKDFYDTKLIRTYLDNLLRVENITELFPHIHDHLDSMLQWWEVCIDKGAEPSAEGFAAFIQARLWKSQMQQRLTAKILYLAGNYRQNFRVHHHLFEGNPSQQVFITKFLEHTSK